MIDLVRRDRVVAVNARADVDALLLRRLTLQFEVGEFSAESATEALAGGVPY